MSDYLDDLKLARAMAGGDERAFLQFFDEYAPRLFRFSLRRMGGDEEAAEEVTQQALSRAVGKISLYRGEASLFTWLCQICRRAASDYLQQSRRHGQKLVSMDDDAEVNAALESMAIDTLAEPASAAERSDLARLVHIVLDYLPGHYADALEWKYIEELDVAEIATRLRVTTLAAQSLLARARTAFREAWIHAGRDAV